MGKGLSLYPESMGLTGKGAGRICLEDEGGALSATVTGAISDYSSGDVRSVGEAIRDISIATISGAITGAIGVRFPGMNRLVEGGIDAGLGIAQRGAYAVLDGDMPWKEKLAYMFDPGQMTVDFISGVVIGEAVDRAVPWLTNRLPAKAPKIGSGAGTNTDISGGLCFVSGTLIKTSNGYKPIESIQPGDRVYSLNTMKTDDRDYKLVTNTYKNTANIFIELTLNKEIIKVTETHRFFVFNRGWIEAYKLTTQDILLNAHNQLCKIQNIVRKIYTYAIDVYNFEVSEWHTYFVSKEDILVHNDCSIGANKWHQGSFSSAEESLLKHFEKHGAKVGAQNVEQYLRKAEEFARNLRGARKAYIPGATKGVFRYYKNGKFIDMVDGKIISFGKQ